MEGTADTMAGREGTLLRFRSTDLRQPKENFMKPWLAILTCVFSQFPAAAWGQEDGDGQGTVGIFQSQQEYYDFMGAVKQSGLTDPAIMEMVPMINDIVLGNPIGSTGQKYDGGMNSAFDLLSNPEVRGDLEMLDDQYQQLQKLDAEVRQRAARQLRDIDFSDSGTVVEQIRRIRDEVQSDLEKVLLPHQLQRLQQLAARSRLRYRSLAELLTSEPLKTRLEISDEQADTLNQAEEEIDRELAEQIAKLRVEARDRLLDRLKRRQREQVEEIFGDAPEIGGASNSKDRKGKDR
jgi:hypothetical protein